jgi:ABC-2 type transport system permease protein
MVDLMSRSDSSGQIFRDLLGGSEALEAFIAYICQMVAIMIGAAGIQQITTYHAEETARTVDLQRSTGLRRWVPLASAALVATLSVILLTAIMHGAGAIGLATQESTISGDYTSLAQASWSMLAPSIFFLGAAVAIVGCIPRATPWAWAPLAVSAVVTLLGEILQLPQWAIDLSPLGHPVTPSDGEWEIALWLTIAGLAMIAIGLIGAQRREIR